MTSRTKRRLKALVIRWEMRFYLLTISLFALTIAFLYIGAPTISNTTVAAIQIVCGIFATLAAMAASIKSDDTTE